MTTETTKTARSAYATTFHRAGDVTVWNVFSQCWTRTSRPSDRVLASLGERERARVIRHCKIED